MITLKEKEYADLLRSAETLNVWLPYIWRSELECSEGDSEYLYYIAREYSDKEIIERLGSKYHI